MKTILVTGASSGIGYEFAKFFVQRGDDVFLLSSHPERISSAAKHLSKGAVGKVYGLAVDLSKQGAAQKVYDLIDRKYERKIDVVVNNAGIGYFDEFINMKVSKIEEMLSVNVTSLVQLTHFFAKDMSERGGGTVINVASVLGFLPFPYSSLYAATKAFVLHFSESLFEELKKKEVNVMALCPGSTETSFFERSKGALEINRTEGVFKFNRMMSPEQVVLQAINALDRKKPIQVVGFKNKIIALAPRILGRKITRLLSARVAKSGLR